MTQRAERAGDDPVPIYAADPHAAGRAASLLRAEGLLATVDIDAAYGLASPLDYARVLVRRADAERALALLREQGFPA